MTFMKYCYKNYPDLEKKLEKSSSDFQFACIFWVICYGGIGRQLEGNRLHLFSNGRLSWRMEGNKIELILLCCWVIMKVIFLSQRNMFRKHLTILHFSIHPYIEILHMRFLFFYVSTKIVVSFFVFLFSLYWI